MKYSENKILTVSSIVGAIQKKLCLFLAADAIKLMVTAVFVYGFVILPIRYYFNLEEKLNVFLCTFTAFAFIIISAKYIIAPLIKFSSTIKTAQWIERKTSAFNGDLLSALEFERNIGKFKRMGFSVPLVLAHIEQTKSSFIEKNILSDKSLRPQYKPIKYWHYLILALILPSAFFQDFYAGSLYSFYEDYFCYTKQKNEVLAIRPGNLKVVYGNDVTVKTVLFKRDNAIPKIFILSKNGVWDNFYMKERSKILFYHTIQSVKSETRYYVEYGGFKSDCFAIFPEKPPVITNHKVTFNYPSYTMLKQRVEAREHFDDIRAVSGTTIIIDIKSNNALKSANLLSEGKTEAFNKIEGNTAFIGFSIDSFSRYTIKIADVLGQSNYPIKPRAVIAVPDKPPIADIKKPGENEEIPSSMEIKLNYSASDDFLVETTEIIYSIGSSAEKHIVLKNKIGSKTIDDSYLWDLTTIGISPGDVVTYKIRAFDNLPSPKGPQFGDSALCSLRLPSVADIYKRNMDALDAPTENMAGIGNEHESILNQMNSIVDKIKESEQLDWAGKQALDQILNGQLKIQDKINKEFISAKQVIEQCNLSGDILKNYSEIQKIMDELLTDEMKQNLSDLREKLERSESFQTLKNQIQLTKEDMEKYGENLKRVLELMKRLSVQNKLEELLKTAKTASAEQDKINKLLDGMRELDNDAKNSIAKQISQMEKMINQMDESQKKLSEESGEITQELQRKLSQLESIFENRQVQQNLKSMFSSINNRDLSSSKSFGDQMKKSLKNIEDCLSSALSGFNTAQINMGALINIVDSLIKISYEFGYLISAIDGFSKNGVNDNTEHAKLMYFIEAELLRIGVKAKKLALESTLINPSYYEYLFFLEKTMRDENETVFKRGGQQVSPMLKNESGNLRELTARWLSLLEALSRQNANGNDGGNQMPANLDEFFSQLKRISDKQSSVNGATQALNNMKPPAGMSLEQYARQLAGEQKMLADALSKLNEAYGKDGRVIGNLKDTAHQMENAAKSISNGDYGTDVINRQKKILTKLLESQKSMKSKDKSNERESKSGVFKPPAKPPAELSGDFLKSGAAAVTPSGSKSYIPPDYRDMVDKYLKYLNESK